MASHGLSEPLTVLGLAPPAATGGKPADASGRPATAGAQGGKPADASGQGGKPAAAGAQGQTGAASTHGAPRKTLVAVEAAGTAVINDKVTALGTGSALQSVTVLPKASGTLTEVSVQSGAAVTAGQVLARLDSDTQQLALDKAKIAADDAQRTLDRNKALVQSNNAPASQTQAAELAVRMADLAVRSAEKDLADRIIAAPIAGVAGIIKVTPGNAVTAQTQIVTIEDASALVVNFWLPERLVGQIAVGAPASLVPVARPDVTLAAKVTSIDNLIDPASGTFQVQAQVTNADATLRPGMAFTVELQFKGQSFATVNPLSVQWGSNGAYVWRVANSKVEKVMIRVVQRNTETVLVAGEIKAGDPIVIEGLDGLKAGADVQVLGAPDGAAANSAAPAKGSEQVASGTATAADAKKPKAQGAAAPAVGN